MIFKILIIAFIVSLGFIKKIIKKIIIQIIKIRNIDKVFLFIFNQIKILNT